MHVTTIPRQLSLRVSAHRLARTATSLALVVACLFNSAAPAFAAVEPAPAGQLATVTPESIDLSLQAGESGTFKLTVQTADVPIPKLDVLFLFDVTSSMSDEIDETKSSSSFIMNSVLEKVKDSAFGLGSFADYPGDYVIPSTNESSSYGAGEDYPWRLDQEITTQADQVEAAINRLALKDGKDWAESYLRALFESLFINWREGAKHVIILFGDAPAHDATFYLSAGGEDMGIDPGVDGVTGSADDLTMESVVSQLKDRGIEVIPVNSATKETDIVQAGFNYIAEQTNGAVYSLDNAKELPETVVAGLSESTRVISSLTLYPDEKFSKWVFWTPPEYPAVGGSESRSFDVTIQVPEDTEAGKYSFYINVDGDKAIIGAMLVNVEVGGPKVELDAATLIANKQQLISEIKALKYMSSVFGIEFELPVGLRESLGKVVKCTDASEKPIPLNAAEDTVSAWLGTLNTSASPAQLEALYRLSVQEQSLKALWEVEVNSYHAGSLQMAHIISLMIVLVTKQDILVDMILKSVVGNLALKVQAYLVAKVFGLAWRVLDWSFSGINSQGADEVKAMREFMVMIADNLADNILKTTNFKRDFVKGIWEKVLLESLVVPLDIVGQCTYEQKAGYYLDRNLTNAKKLSGNTAISLEQAQERLGKVAGQANNLVEPLNQRSATVSKELAKLEKEQEALAFSSDVFDFASVYAKYTGLGTVISLFLKLISIVIRLADMVMSKNFMIRAYNVTADSLFANQQIAEITFPKELAQFYTPGAPQLALQHPLAVAPGQLSPFLIHPDAPQLQAARSVTPPAAAKNLKLSPILSERSLLEMARLDERNQAFNDLLQQLAEAVRNDDARNAAPLIEKILAEDDNLSVQYTVTEKPVFRGAPTLVGEEASGEFDVYSQVGQSGADYLGQGAKFYLLLLGWTSDPKDAALKQQLLDQIAALSEATHHYQSSIEAARPMVEAYANEPGVVILRYSLPAKTAGIKSIPVIVEVKNPTPAAVHDITVAIKASRADQPLAFTQAIGSLAPDQSQSVTLEVAADISTQISVLEVSASDGYGDSRLISLPAQGDSNTGGNHSGSSSTTRRQTSGFGVALLLLAMVLGGAFVYIAGVRRKAAGRLPGRGPVPTPSGSFPSLATVSGNTGRQVIPILRDGFLIGRGSSCDLRLPDPAVSRQHARLRYAQSAWYIQDLNSAGGTFVNGQKIASARLMSNDQIQIGGAVFRFTWH